MCDAAGYSTAMSATAVLVVDMMNSYQHPDAEHLIPNVEKIIDPLADLVQRARDADDIDLVYVNDNYGDFTADFSDLVRVGVPRRASRPGGSDRADPALPDADEGPAQRLLRLTGGLSAAPTRHRTTDLDRAGHRAVHPLQRAGRLRAAFPVVIPTDAVAGIDAELGDAALAMMQRNMDAELTTAAECIG